MGPDGEESGVEAAQHHHRAKVDHLGPEVQPHAYVEDALDLGVEHLARQAVFGDAEAHHATRDRARLMDLDVVTHAP